MFGLRHLLLAGFAGLGLAACSQADLPPKRQPGLWEQQVNIGDLSRTTNVCIDDDTDKKVDWWGTQMNRGACKSHKITGRADGGWDFASVCDMGTNGTVATKGVVYGNFVQSFMVRGEQTTTGALLASSNGVRKVAINARYVDACPKPYQPGDMWVSGLKPKPDESTVKQVGPVPYNDNAVPIPEILTLKEAAQGK